LLHTHQVRPSSTGERLTMHANAHMKAARDPEDPKGSLTVGGIDDVVKAEMDRASDLVKAGFISRVYGILSVQLFLTVASSAFFMFHEPTRAFVLANHGMLLTASILPFGFLLGLQCYKDSHPTNMLLLGGFTVSMSYMTGVVCAAYYQQGLGLVVLQALVLTAAVFISLTTYAHISKKDFSFLGAGLFAGLWILIIWSLLNWFFDFGVGGRMVFSLVGALIFVGYILYDTSMIIHHLGPDDAIVAAISLYLDLINLFLYLLEFLRMIQGGDN